MEDAARVLSSAARKRIDAAKIRADIESGAPTNADGTINVVHYGAWLVKEMARGNLSATITTERTLPATQLDAARRGDQRAPVPSPPRAGRLPNQCKIVI